MCVSRGRCLFLLVREKWERWLSSAACIGACIGDAWHLSMCLLKSSGPAEVDFLGCFEAEIVD